MHTSASPDTSAPPAGAAADAGLPLPQRYHAIVVVALGVTLAVLDSAIANVALPTIARHLRASAAGSIWIVNAYQLSVTISLLPLASLGDRIGYRRVYLGGLALFTLASLGCALSTSLPMLALARMIQGLGAAGVMSVNTALVRMIYPRQHLGRGVAINAMVVAIASALGPTIASGVLSVASWPWLFAVNVPIGVAAFALGVRALPVNPPHRAPYDYLSAVMNALVFGLVIFAVDGLGHGERRALVAGELIAAAVIGWFFVRRQLTQPAPLLPVDLLRIPVFALSIGTSVCSFCAQMLAFVSLPFLLQETLGLSQVQTGLLMTPWPLVIVGAAPLAGVLSDRYPAGMLGGIGLTLFAAGLLSLATLGANPTAFDICWRMALCGAGFGTFQSPNNRQMLSAAPRERSGGASGMLGTARLTGQTLGAAFVALIFGVAPQHGPTIALYLAAAFAIVAAVVSMMRLMPGSVARA
ncbi:MFS transporter [Paraburkholderia caballeronis]|uniref:MFS transporter, DHA2 family, multidrug resistance protein n=2 Tax=Paraburkholderia caballeronis TaxID=416943 RepID=A0A1H7W1W0_9BURK|nr:MFS transporter [Paraburkholderia caballeronis]PXW22777.1 DHA2 family multidrug resistance protein-like MFS transporter [Paraburkholderia caballeronis]PXW96880.1 DHA2 family multidrug resistance protein-like MFS transporter [Paraburkholderia caballeronis]RAJ93507.1 DHA2 family multidrug resistance protein-like MFS transporter [Paraburkholderia caballeronis]SEC75538.1 MFS transporter, DHA2 family, multidrug resistance protein [Paraburkholderia caballeronis]SEM15089.1 MFS transporter, DHA2 fa